MGARSVERLPILSLMACHSGPDRGRCIARLHEVLLPELRTVGLLDTDDAAIDDPRVRALRGFGSDLGQSPGATQAANITGSPTATDHPLVVPLTAETDQTPHN